MKRIVRLTERDLTRIVKRIIKEHDEQLFHKKTNENGVFISVKETMNGIFELYISDDDSGFGEVYLFEVTGKAEFKNIPVVFAKYGLEDELTGKSDYDGLNVEGKIV